jgi:predicted  nucleic acid-binding Zn-ribbon protein
MFVNEELREQLTALQAEERELERDIEEEEQKLKVAFDEEQRPTLEKEEDDAGKQCDL